MHSITRGPSRESALTAELGQRCRPRRDSGDGQDHDAGGVPAELQVLQGSFGAARGLAGAGRQPPSTAVACRAAAVIPAARRYVQGLLPDAGSWRTCSPGDERGGRRQRRSPVRSWARRRLDLRFCVFACQEELAVMSASPSCGTAALTVAVAPLPSADDGSTTFASPCAAARSTAS